MLPSTNNVVTISRLAANGDITEYSDVITGLEVYINQTREDVVPGYEGQPNFRAFRMMTDGDHDAIEFHDRVTDQDGVQYEVVAPPSISDDITGKHHQYLLVVQET